MENVGEWGQWEVRVGPAHLEGKILRMKKESLDLKRGEIA